MSAFASYARRGDARARLFRVHRERARDAARRPRRNQPKGQWCERRAMEVSTVAIPDDLVRCEQCGELKGRSDDPRPGVRGIKCLCEGIVCRYCKQNAIHRPISDYYDEPSGIVYHVPHFGYLFPCWECRRRRRRQELLRLAYRRPWKLVARPPRPLGYDVFRAGGGLSLILRPMPKHPRRRRWDS
jgi:hypothetical protein